MLRYPETTPEDLEALAEIRVAAMRESLEAIGRFDPERARRRLADSFAPAHARWIDFDGERIGFYQLRPTGLEFRLDHLYLLPAHQGQGIGRKVLEHIFAETQNAPITLGALNQSPANAFYQAHGFQIVEATEWDTEYRRTTKLSP